RGGLPFQIAVVDRRAAEEELEEGVVRADVRRPGRIEALRGGEVGRRKRLASTRSARGIRACVVRAVGSSPPLIGGGPNARRRTKLLRRVSIAPREQPAVERLVKILGPVWTEPDHHRV